MDMYRSIGIAAAGLGIVIIVAAWVSAPAALGTLDPTIAGYSRNTVLLIALGLIAIAVGATSYLMAKPTT